MAEAHARCVPHSGASKKIDLAEGTVVGRPMLGPGIPQGNLKPLVGRHPDDNELGTDHHKKEANENPCDGNRSELPPSVAEGR